MLPSPFDVLSYPLLGLNTMNLLSKQHRDAPLSLEVHLGLEEDFCSSLSRSSDSLFFSTGPQDFLVPGTVTNVPAPKL